MAESLTITASPWSGDQSGSTSPSETLALAILWSAAEPGRLSEVMLIPSGAVGQYILGRGQRSENDGSVRLKPIRQRPGRNEPTPPLSSPALSRSQLAIRRGEALDLRVDNIGRCPMYHNGQAATAGLVQPGDTLMFEGQLLLLCVRRQELMQPFSTDTPVSLHAFGEADANGIVGESPASWALRRELHFIARRHAHVLIQGASGTGKELAAQAVHRLSARSAQPMVSRNAASLPESLIDAELFGNARSYPNVGMPERPGLLGQADGSTLFLDEFGTLSNELQAHLLRVLDSGEYQRLGESIARRSDFRLIAATNADENAIKHDLLARLKLRLQLPDLNERREDIPLLVHHLLRRIATHDADIARRYFVDGDVRTAPRIAPEFIELLVRRTYSTHVREVEVLLWRAMAEGHQGFLAMRKGGGKGEGGDGDQTPLLGPVSTAPAPRPLEEQPLPARAVAAKDSNGPGTPPDTATSHTIGLDRIFNLQEQTLLNVLRRYRFRVADCLGVDGLPTGRSRVDLLVRVLLFKALEASNWDVERCSAYISGPSDGKLTETVKRRLQTSLRTLRSGLKSEDALVFKRRLALEYQGAAPHVEAVVEAMLVGQLVLSD